MNRDYTYKQKCSRGYKKAISICRVREHKNEFIDHDLHACMLKFIFKMLPLQKNLIQTLRQVLIAAPNVPKCKVDITVTLPRCRNVIQSMISILTYTEPD